MAAHHGVPGFWKAYVNPAVTPAGEATVAKAASMVVKVGALACILTLDPQYAIDLQLLGGLWILQTFPAVVFGLFTRWFRAPALLAGWAVGLAGGSWLAHLDGLKPIHTLHLGGASYGVYTGLLALGVNVLVVLVVNALLPAAPAAAHPEASGLGGVASS